MRAAINNKRLNFFDVYSRTAAAFIALKIRKNKKRLFKQEGLHDSVHSQCPNSHIDKLKNANIMKEK